MSFLTKCERSRCADFLSIPGDAVPRRTGEDVDLFVGKNKIVTITLPNSRTTRYRDVVVLGRLIIQSFNPAYTAAKPLLLVRDFIAPRKSVSVDNVNIKCRTFYQPENREMFHKELLQELFLERLEIQKESVDQIGLKSILSS